MFITKKLNQYVTSVHEENKQFNCEVCDYRSSRKFTLDHNVTSVHEEKKQFKSEVCDYRSSRKFTLDQMLHQFKKKKAIQK